MTPKKYGYWFSAFILLILVVACTGETKPMSKTAQQHAANGQQETPLSACPGSPNCVCSCDVRERHAIAPLTVPVGVEDPISALSGLIQAMPRVAIIDQNERYLRATFKSRIFRFTDDVEFYFDGSVVQVRSESRLGYSDFGANRQRVEHIREHFEPAAESD